MKEVRSRSSGRGEDAPVRASLAVLLGLLVVGACDFPTAAPILEPRFVIPGTNTSLSVEQLLPGSITYTGDRFAASVSGGTTRWMLGSLCGTPCMAAQGLVAPKPPFSATLTTKAPLPADVLSANVRGGTLTLEIVNNLNFDPLHPSATARGSAVVELRHGSQVLAADTVRHPLPPGSVTAVAIPLQAWQLTGALTIALTIDSPAGDPIRVDTTGSLALRSSATSRIEMSEAVVRVTNRTIQSAGTRLDLSDIDGTTRDHVLEGGLLLQVENPFAATGMFVLETRPEGGAAIMKTLTQIGPGASTQRVPFTGEEMRQLLGRPVTLLIRGVVNQESASGVILRPGDRLRIRADLDLTLTTGASGAGR